jgi:hypothetical protein
MVVRSDGKRNDKYRTVSKKGAIPLLPKGANLMLRSGKLNEQNQVFKRHQH